MTCLGGFWEKSMNRVYFVILHISVLKGISSWCFGSDAPGVAGTPAEELRIPCSLMDSGPGCDLGLWKLQVRGIHFGRQEERPQLLILRTACFGPRNHTSRESIYSVSFLIFVCFSCFRESTALSQEEKMAEPCSGTPLIEGWECTLPVRLLLVIRALEPGSWRVWTLFSISGFFLVFLFFLEGEKNNDKYFSWEVNVPAWGHLDSPRRFSVC